MKTIKFESAQHVWVEFELALPIQRAIAAALDSLIFIIYMLIFLFIAGSSGMNDFMLVELLMLKIPWILYHPVLEYLTQGQTLGKYIMGIRVLTVSGERLGLREIFTRWMFKGYFLWIGFSFSGMLAGIPELIFIGAVHLIIGFIGFIYSGLSDQRQRLGDLMAGTVVIRNKSSIRYTLNDVLTLKNVENHQPTYPMVTKFTDDDMLLIKRTMQRLRSNPNEASKRFAIELADEAARKLGLPETPEKRMAFLQVLLQDYVILTR